MEIEKLNAVLESHLKWLTSGHAEGECAYLTGAYLTGADLTDADLTDADLTGAYLTGAYLTGAYLGDANLRGADLTGAYLTGAYLTPIKDDFFEVLSAAPTEVPGLLNAVREGRIDGSHYEGECACLVGTIANIKKCEFNKIEGLLPNSSRPAERFFIAIRPGQKPENHQPSKIVEDWILEWMGKENVGCTEVKS